MVGSIKAENSSEEMPKKLKTSKSAESIKQLIASAATRLTVIVMPQKLTEQSHYTQSANSYLGEVTLKQIFRISTGREECGPEAVAGVSD